MANTVSFCNMLSVFSMNWQNIVHITNISIRIAVFVSELTGSKPSQQNQLAGATIIRREANVV